MGGGSSERFQANRAGVSELSARLTSSESPTGKRGGEWAEPNQLSEGMRWVLVNGIPVIADGKATGALPGRVLRGPGWSGG